MRFLHCCFDAAEAKAKDLAFVDQSDTSSSSDEDPILGIGGINSDRGAKKKVLLEIVGAAGLSHLKHNSFQKVNWTAALCQKYFS